MDKNDYVQDRVANIYDLNHRKIKGVFNMIDISTERLFEQLWIFMRLLAEEQSEDRRREIFQDAMWVYDMLFVRACPPNSINDRLTYPL